MFKQKQRSKFFHGSLGLIKGGLHKLAGYILIILSGSIIYWILYFRLSIPDHSHNSTLSAPFISFWFGLWLAVARFIYSLGSRFLILRGSKVLHRCEKEDFVLYLRSFKEDREPGFILQGSGYLDVKVRYRPSEEMLIAESLKKTSFCVAVGQPGESLPMLGMYRFYLPKDDWQGKVKELMSKAKLIVIHVSNEPGHWWWELENALKNVKPERLLLLLPFENYKSTSILSIAVNKEDEYEIFRTRVADAFAYKIPSFCGVKIGRGRLTGMIYFDSNGAPYIVGLTEFGLAAYQATLKRAFKYALKHVRLNQSTTT